MNIPYFLLNLLSIRDEINREGLPSRLNQLIPFIDAYRAEPTLEAKQALDVQIDEVQKVIDSLVDIVANIPESRSFLAEIKYEKILDAFLGSRLNTMIYNDVYEARTLVAALAEMLNRFIEYATGIISGLESFGIKAASAEESLLTVEMLDSSREYTTQEMSDLMDRIQRIVLFYARVSDDPADSNPPFIRAISKSSPLTIQITATADFPTILMLITMTLTWAISKREQKIKYKETQSVVLAALPEDAEKQKNEISKLLQKYEKDAFTKTEIDRHVKELAGSVKASLDKKVTPEEKAFLTKGVEELIKLTEEGAAVSTHLSTDATQEVQDALKSGNLAIYKTTKELEIKTKQIDANGTLRITAKEEE